MIQIYDTTLRDGEQTPGVHFSRAQKLDIAKRLCKLGVDTLEAGFPAASEGDFDAVAAIADASGKDQLGDMTVSALSRMRRDDVDAARDALDGAKRKRLHLFIATSDVHLEYKLHITRMACLSVVAECTAYAKNLGAFDEIEFSAEDATRTDPAFLTEVVRTAVENGADIINVPDTVGYTTPDEYRRILRGLREQVPGDYLLSVHCHNDLGMATANSLAAVEAGAGQVECTVNGLGERAGNAAMEEIVMALRVRGDAIFPDRDPGEPLTRIRTEEIMKTSAMVASLSGVSVAPNKAIVGGNAFSHASGIHQHGVMQARETYEIMNPEEIGLKANTIILGKLSGRHAFVDRIEALGYSLTPEGIEHTFRRFKEIANQKDVMTNEDLHAIVGEYLDGLEGLYWLNSFQIQSGNHIRAMALVTLEVRRDGLSGVSGLSGSTGQAQEDGSDENSAETVTEAAPGEGPVDAAFNAINRIAGAEGVELLTYNITAVTEGTDALGEAKVTIRAGQQTFTGRGVSTDIIKASIKAYLSAINKWVVRR